MECYGMEKCELWSITKWCKKSSTCILSRIGPAACISMAFALALTCTLYCVSQGRFSTSLGVKWTERSKGGGSKRPLYGREFLFVFVSVVEWFSECFEMIDWCSFASSHALLWK